MPNYIIDLLGKTCIPLVIAYVTFRIAKKQIINTGVTQFRQQWIDNLRNAISLFIAKAEMIAILELDDDETYFAHFTELCQMQFKVELMLNPLESDHNRINDCIARIRNIIHDENIKEKRLDKNINMLLEVSKQVLKQEWILVKKGK